MNNGIVRATVEENPDGFSTTVVDFVVVDLDIVAALGSDDTCVSFIPAKRLMQDQRPQGNKIAECTKHQLRVHSKR